MAISQSPKSTRTFSDRYPPMEPFEYVDRLGLNFMVGVIASAPFHAVKGAILAGSGARLAGAAQAVRVKAPLSGTRFAVWSVIRETIDDTVSTSDEPPLIEPFWSLPISCFVPTFLLTMHRGALPAAGWAALSSAVALLCTGVAKKTQITDEQVEAMRKREQTWRQQPVTMPLTSTHKVCSEAWSYVPPLPLPLPVPEEEEEEEDSGRDRDKVLKCADSPTVRIPFFDCKWLWDFDKELGNIPMPEMERANSPDLEEKLGKGKEVEDGAAAASAM